ncbi:MAG: hypothetical protein WCS42_12795 [Verrucomicrobiota bacterium]
MANQNAPLPQNEWDFTGPQIVKPPPWQWNDWLNYEYARSCRPIVKAVLELRDRKVPEREFGSLPPAPKFPRHALYLASRYPDFPLKPWLKIPASHRNKQAESGDHVGSPLEANVLEAWDAFDFTERIATGDIWLNPLDLADQKYAVFKIDFRRDQKLIEKKFRFWLERRREEYSKIRPSAKSPNRRKEVNSGQSKNKRNYIVAFKQLAALRLLEHFQYDYQECVAETMADAKSKPLYFAGNNTRWFEAANHAAARLVHFNVMWTLEAEPAYFFKFHEIHEKLRWHPSLQIGLRADLKHIQNKNEKKHLLKALFCGYRDRQGIAS